LFEAAHHDAAETTNSKKITEKTIEVALIEITPSNGIRLLGRTTEARVIETVRRHLVCQLQPNAIPTADEILPQPSTRLASSLARRIRTSQDEEA